VILSLFATTLPMPKATRTQRTKELLRAYGQYLRLSQDLETRRNTLLTQHGDASDLDDAGSDDLTLQSLDFEPRLELLFESDDKLYHADDDSSDSDESDDSEVYSCSNRMSSFVKHEIELMFSRRYEEPRDRLPRGPAFLNHVLSVFKESRPDHFRQALRVSPLTFDKLVNRIALDPVFFNNSNQSQMPVEHQLAITLYRFGHNGNAASLQSVANWAGVGKGTVTLATRRVMTAVLHADFMHEVVRMPNDAEKETAKQWVEEHSCEAWRGGWCFVDGTLVPLASRPHWYGPSYFDRKSNYSLNVQVNYQETSLCFLMLMNAERSYHCLIYASLTTVMGSREAHMTLLHGMRREWLKSIAFYLNRESGSGLTRHIQLRIFFECLRPS
jgi:hypothetical protein